MSTLGQRIRFAREAKGLTQTVVAKPFNIARNNVSSWESDETRPGQEKLPALAQMLDVSLEWLMSDASEIAEQTPPPREPPSRAGYNPPPEILGARDLPVYASAEAGNGAMVIYTDPIDFVPRPWYLKQVKDGYAVLVNGSSMEPVYDPGDMVIVNPKAPLVKGKDVIIVGGEHDGEYKASLKRYQGQNESEWFLKQFNPPEGQEKEFRRPKREWPRALRVVGSYDGS